MEKRYLKLAKEIKAEMLTSKAGCYRLEKLPRTMTDKNVAQLLYALEKSTDEHREEWKKVFETSLYKKNGAEYCHVLAHVCRTRIPL